VWHRSIAGSARCRLRRTWNQTCHRRGDSSRTDEIGKTRDFQGPKR